MRALLWLLRGRDPQEQQAIKQDAEMLLAAARAHGRSAVATTWLALMWDLTIGIGHDLARALRSLVRAPGFTVTVSLLLGLGVAATTTLFALINAVILKPLPYASPEQLVMVWESNVPLNRLREGPSPGNVDDWVANNDAFEALTSWWTAQATLRGRDGSAPVSGVQVTKGFFEVFRRAPLLGRTFAADEYVGAPSIPSGRTGGREPVLVLSHRLWQSLGADPALVGGTVLVEGRNWRVLGVMPADFAIPDLGAAFWTPWDIRDSYRGPRFADGPPREARFLRAVGRLKPGLSREAATERMESLAARIAADHPRTNENWTVELVPLRDELVRSSRTELLARVRCGVRIASARLRQCSESRDCTPRIAGARDGHSIGARRRPFTHRQGASRGDRVVRRAYRARRHRLTASSLGAAVAFAPSDIPRLHEVDVNARVVWFAIVTAMLVTIIGVFLPGLRGELNAIAPTLKDGAPVSGQNASSGATRTRGRGNRRHGRAPGRRGTARPQFREPATRQSRLRDAEPARAANRARCHEIRRRSAEERATTLGFSTPSASCLEWHRSPRSRCCR